ncbi:MAG: sterol desaturase family protein [Geminicoccaceae bacterium]
MIILLDLSLLAVIVFEALILTGAIFHHSAARIPARLERALASVIVTPSIHWVHHHAIRADTDSNYGDDLQLLGRIVPIKERDGAICRDEDRCRADAGPAAAPPPRRTLRRSARRLTRSEVGARAGPPVDQASDRRAAMKTSMAVQRPGLPKTGTRASAAAAKISTARTMALRRSRVRVAPMKMPSKRKAQTATIGRQERHERVSMAPSRTVTSVRIVTIQAGEPEGETGGDGERRRIGEPGAHGGPESCWVPSPHRPADHGLGGVGEAIQAIGGEQEEIEKDGR